MSDGNREAVRGSHRNAEGASVADQASATTESDARGTVAGVRHSSEIIVGWRVWGLSTVPTPGTRSSSSTPIVLVSVYMNSLWQPGDVMTACCGADSVRHGIHAFTTQAEALAYMSEARKPLRYVFGEVSLWGRVVVHERGYRAQSAYPRHIFVPQRYRGGRDIAAELRRSYGVDADWAD